MDFKQIYAQYNQQIYRLCLGYTNDEAWAKDIVQDTFVAVWKNLEKFEGKSALNTWIYRIAVNNCIKQLKKQRIRSEQEVSNEVESPIEEHPKLLMLRKFISELPEVDRIIISMELEEIPQAEIAEVLNLSPGNVRVKIHRIKETLSKKFKAQKNV